MASPYRRLNLHTLAAAAGWLLLIAGAMLLARQAEISQLHNLAENTARAHFYKDQAFRLWAASHGGVYVPADARTPPNPILAHVAERDIFTPSGRSLTLMNPAYMLRQMMGEYRGLYGTQGKITSLNPINPGNAPDQWEREALLAFAQGAEELMEYTEIDGQPHLRLMRPMITEVECLKCHARQGYQPGDIRGGVGVAVPLTPFLAEAAKTTRKLAAIFIMIGAVGLALIGFFHLRGRQRISEQLAHQAQQQLMENRLRQAQKMEAIGTLAGGIAHDFNNILTPIMGFAELALHNLPPDSPSAGDLKQVVKAAGRARDLVRQILAFSRRGDQESRPLKPDLIAKEALKLLRATLPSTIEIRQDIPADCGAVLADPAQFHQVLMNLCTNAFYAMREKGGVLAVGLEKISLTEQDVRFKGMALTPGPYLKIEISDTGGGMERAVMERIFEPYFTTKPLNEGTGLGLAVVHGIVHQYGGHISVYSEPGQGTTFHVYLPLVETEAGGAEAAVDGGLPLARNHERILVVDDEPVITSMLRNMLEYLGYRVTALTDAREAARLLREQPGDFNLLITDMTMPHLTGAELAKQALAAEPSPRVILCTGFSELINQEKSRALGIHAFVMKPVTLQSLARTIDQVLNG